jgi:hypothetical protein
MIIGVEALRDGIGHFDLPGSIGTPNRPDRHREDIAVPNIQAGGLGRCGHRRNSNRDRGAQSVCSIAPRCFGAHQFVRR